MCHTCSASRSQAKIGKSFLCCENDETQAREAGWESRFLECKAFLKPEPPRTSKSCLSHRACKNCVSVCLGWGGGGVKTENNLHLHFALEVELKMFQLFAGVEIKSCWDNPGDLEVTPSRKINRLDEKIPSLIFLMGLEKLYIKVGADLSGTARSSAGSLSSKLHGSKNVPKKKSPKLPQNGSFFCRKYPESCAVSI